MSNKRFGIEFDGFDKAVSRLTKLEGDVKGITEKALKATNDHIVPNLHSAMSKHKLTGDTDKSIVENPKVEWAGSVGSISVGFDLKNGGLASVFLMYGTPRHAKNHPGQKKDKKLHDSIFGTSTQREIRKIQEDIFFREIRKLESK
ncbi:MAG: hypothetical protein MJ000_11710 [Bacteroidales bacterium]|nr:hypothetical protein [Bacteroidales bacterium]